MRHWDLHVLLRLLREILFCLAFHLWERRWRALHPSGRRDPLAELYWIDREIEENQRRR